MRLQINWYNLEPIYLMITLGCIYTWQLKKNHLILPTKSINNWKRGKLDISFLFLIGLSIAKISGVEIHITLDKGINFFGELFTRIGSWKHQIGAQLSKYCIHDDARPVKYTCGFILYLKIKNNAVTTYSTFSMSS